MFKPRFNACGVSRLFIDAAKRIKRGPRKCRGPLITKELTAVSDQRHQFLVERIEPGTRQPVESVFVTAAEEPTGIFGLAYGKRGCCAGRRVDKINAFEIRLSVAD